MQKKDILKVILTTIIIYNMIPIINRLFPETETYTFLTDLWILNSICAFVCSLLFCKRYGFKLWIALVVAILFMPTMLIFYNSSVLIFAIVYFAISMLSCVIGAVCHKRKIR